MLNLVNASQSYVADIVSAYANDKELKSLVRTLDGFTVNLAMPESNTLEKYHNDTGTDAELVEEHKQYEPDNDKVDVKLEKPRIKIDNSKFKVIKLRV